MSEQPATGTGLSALASVSCTSANVCTAVGFQQGSTAQSAGPLAEQSG